MSAEEQKLNDTETEAVPMENINNAAADGATLLPKEENAVNEKMNNDINGDVESGEKSSSNKRLSIQAIRSAAFTAAEDILENPRNRKILIIAGGVLLFLLLLVVTVLIFFVCPDDSTHRFIRIVPKPRGPHNMIYFRHGGDGSEGGRNRQWQDMADQIDDFLQPYRRQIGTTHCPIAAGGRKAFNMSNDAVCNFDLNSVAKECLSGDYGYKAGTPCIFLVFNNIEDWEPFLGANKSSVNGDALSKHFVNLECSANTQFDMENSGPMEFTPFQGWSSMFFPFKHQPNYLSPFVVMRLAAPTQNVGIGMTCKLVAHNIHHESDARFHTEEPVPYIPFNVFIE